MTLRKLLKKKNNMKAYGIYCLLLLVLVSCNSEPTLEKYFVANTENKNFLVVDVGSDILNVDKTKLSTAETEALGAFEKMNVLAFKLNDKNKGQFDIERAKVDLILKDKKYQELIKVGSGKDNASISFIGTDDHIEEFVLFANKKEVGFTVVRILGKDMNATKVIALRSIFKKAKIDLKQLKPFEQLMK